ncbi:unnamed protein product [Cladocopium goreaui]|uniref:EF-hand domain-containing protein n=1 Tax=Cladocopium goreaui TaxID=2562237 RepID=A0A9P1C5V1_9DINO|nr:unnamed protein product [Cladocopium goreaui]
MSPFSLREAAYTKETIGFGIYRQSIDDEISEHDAEIAAFALHRMDCQRQAGLREREQAALWRKRRDAREPLYQVRWLLLQHLARKPPTPPPLDDEEDELPSGLPDGFEAPSGPPSRPPTPAHFWPTQSTDFSQSLFGLDERTPVTDRVLERLKSRSHNMGQERNWRLTLMRKRTQREKARKLALQYRTTMFLEDTEVNVTEFLSNIKPKEAQAYQAILRQLCSNRKVDKADLQKVLSELGFRPRTPEEREILRKILAEIESLEVDFDDVVQTIIPNVRTQFAELRGPGLLDLFTEADEDKSPLDHLEDTGWFVSVEMVPAVEFGMMTMPFLLGGGNLSVEELLAVLQRSGFFPQNKEVAETLMEVIPGAKNHQNMEGKLLMDRVSISLSYFKVVGPLLQERSECQRLQMELQIAEELSLDAEERQLWQDSLLDLWEAFQRFSDDRLEVDRLPLVFMDTELLPKHGSLRSFLCSMAEAELAKSERSKVDRLDLRQCLKILSKIREKELSKVSMERECQRVIDVFNQNDSDSTNGLSLEECQKCLEDCGIKAKEEESEFITCLIDEYDLDESGELELEEFLRMVKFVTSRLRRQRLRQQADLALEYGWGAEEFDFMRLNFMLADKEMDGNIRDDEIAWSVSQLRAEWPPEDTKLILREMGLVTWNSSISVDLAGFLKVMNYVDLRLKHRRIGSLLGLEKGAVDNFCSVWWSMKPQNDMVPISTLDARRGRCTQAGY